VLRTEVYGVVSDFASFFRRVFEGGIGGVVHMLRVIWVDGVGECLIGGNDLGAFIRFSIVTREGCGD
jgi:hypothetical protein